MARMLPLAATVLALALPCLGFSAEDMLSAPRPQVPILNPNRELALNVVDQWDHKADEMTRSLYLVNITNTTPKLLVSTSPSEMSDLFWLSNDRFAYLNGSDITAACLNGTTSSLFTFDFPPADLQYHSKTDTLYFAAQVWEGSGLEDVVKGDRAYEVRGFDAEVFDDLFIRHWDTWRKPGKVWTIGALDLKSGKLDDILRGTGLYQRMDAPAYTLSATHMAVTVKPAHLNYATHTRTDVILLPLSGKSSPVQLTPHAHGAISAATFDSSGRKLAWLEMREDGYEADQNVLHIAGTKSGKWDDIKRETGAKWEKSPTAITWSDSLYLTAEWHGRSRAFRYNGSYHEIPSNGSVTSVQVVSDDTILYTASSFTSPADAFLLNTTSDKATRLTDWSGKHVKPLEAFKGEEFWFTGADGREIMAWVIKPKTDKKVPMAFLIHGGPQGAWEDVWSTRWNPALYAAKGYFVVAVNPTGSTGYGQELVDRIQHEWGGRPFKDLMAGYHAALKAFPQIDPARTAVLGASYGGYMANWIQGHNDQFGFKAIVCHDGIFDTATSYYTTEEVWFPTHEFGDGVSGAAVYQKWNPMNHVAEWSTPELVIHGGKDYRLVASQGIAAFTALQTRGVPSRFLYFPNENHWVLSPKNSRKWHYEVFRWLEEWVGEKDASTGIEKASQDKQTVLS